MVSNAVSFVVGGQQTLELCRLVHMHMFESCHRSSVIHDVHGASGRCPRVLYIRLCGTHMLSNQGLWRFHLSGVGENSCPSAPAPQFVQCFSCDLTPALLRSWSVHPIAAAGADGRVAAGAP